MPAVHAHSSADSTRSRLIEIAGEIFAERGFEAATVKEITQGAQVNIASINYHFGDKLGLYSEVLRKALVNGRLSEMTGPGGAPEQLTEYVTRFIEALVGEGRPSWCRRLMARELAEPTPALPMVVVEVIQPNYQLLCGIISTIAGLSTDEERVRLAAHSVISQCVHWCHARPLLPYLWPELELTRAQVGRIATHIAKFSLAGIRATASRTAAEEPEA
jgi:AcrR family transcriptional regulator